MCLRSGDVCLDLPSYTSERSFVSRITRFHSMTYLFVCFFNCIFFRFVSLWCILLSLLCYLLLCNNQHSIHGGLKNSALVCGLVLPEVNSWYLLGHSCGLGACLGWRQENFTSQDSSGWGCSSIQGLLSTREPWVWALAPYKWGKVAHVCQLSTQQIATGGSETWLETPSEKKKWEKKEPLMVQFLFLPNSRVKT